MVTFCGKAKNAAEKDLATKHVNDVNGVKSVKNPDGLLSCSDSKTEETVIPLPVGRVMQEWAVRMSNQKGGHPHRGLYVLFFNIVVAGGLFSGYTLGGVIHVLLVIALILWWWSRLFRGRRRV